MAIIKPFAALRPRPDLASRICELPYDVMSSEEARVMAEGNPYSFLRVSKPEIEFPAGTDAYSSQIYERGRENLEKLIAQGALRQDDKPHFYFYRQIMGPHSQVGLVAVASCEEYQKGIIKKHELTRVDKEDDRVRHIETLNSQTGPVFLTYKAESAIDSLASRITAGTPDVDFTASDGVRHTSWVVNDLQDIQFIESRFAQIPYLYIADGHHRSAAASRICIKRNGAGHSGRFLAVVFPHNQMSIQPYNRVLKDLNGLPASELFQKLERVFSKKTSSTAKPTGKHDISFYMQGQWRTFTFRPEFTRAENAVDRLDVAILQQQVLGPIFGIDDPRTSKRINFVGGIRGTAELEKLVNNGEYACAFSMYPTSIEDLMSVADAGGIMPPKSTWFEPKLRDAMFCHMI